MLEMEKFELIVNGEEVLFTEEQIIKALEEILDNQYLDKVDGHYEQQMYADYRDELGENQVQEIVEAGPGYMLEEFYQQLEDHAMSSSDYEYGALIETIIENWDEDTYGEFYEYEDVIRDYVQENVYFNYPYDHFLNQEIKVNLMVDTGDGNYDYTLNNFAHGYYGAEEEEIDQESSLLWLVKEQGYTYNDLANTVNGDKDDNKFLNSVVDESANVTTQMNGLTFFIKMTLKDFIEYVDNKKTIVLSSGTRCGLYDPWSGAGSLHEIELEKDIEVPWAIAEPGTEGSRGYSVDSIYGVFNDYWTDTVKDFK
jgi:hypothetical protein